MCDFEIQGAPSRRQRVKMESLILRLNLSRGGGGVDEAEWLSLVLLPRIDGSPLYVNGSNIPADCPAFITLHRSVRGSRPKSDDDDDAPVFASSSEDRVELEGRHGLSFEVHLGQHRLFGGFFFRAGANQRWSLECKCIIVNPHIMGLLHITQAHLSLSLSLALALTSPDNDKIVLRHTVPVEVETDQKWRMNRRWRRISNCKTAFQVRLQDILELDEEQEEEEEEEDNCDCESDHVDDRDGEEGSDDFYCQCHAAATHHPDHPLPFGMDMDMDMDMLHFQHHPWAVDLSFWALCFGLAFFLSRASTNALPLSKFLPL